jgi:predicted transcriptional regulator
MRTTINLPEELLAQVKKLAAASHSTVTALIEDALREAVAKPRRKRPKKRVGLRTYGKQGLLPGVEIDDTASLLELMETPVGPARR